MRVKLWKRVKLWNPSGPLLLPPLPLLPLAVTGEAGLYSGFAFPDGSGVGHPRYKSFGWGFVFLSESSSEVVFSQCGCPAGVRATLSVLRCELLGLCNLLQYAQPPLTVAIDNSTVVKGLRRGRRWCVAGNRSHADVWRQIWNPLDDVFPDLVGFQAVKIQSHSKALLETEDPHVRSLARGNQLADEAAKEGTPMAPRPVGVAMAYKKKYDDVQAVLKFVADLTVRAGSFSDTTPNPPKRRTRGGRESQPRASKPPARPHILNFGLGSVVSCLRCGRKATVARERRKFVKQGCPGLTVCRSRGQVPEPAPSASSTGNGNLFRGHSGGLDPTCFATFAVVLCPRPLRV